MLSLYRTAIFPYGEQVYAHLPLIEADEKVCAQILKSSLLRNDVQHFEMELFGHVLSIPLLIADRVVQMVSNIMIAMMSSELISNRHVRRTNL